MDNKVAPHPPEDALLPLLNLYAHMCTQMSENYHSDFSSRQSNNKRGTGTSLFRLPNGHHYHRHEYSKSHHPVLLRHGEWAINYCIVGVIRL